MRMCWFNRALGIRAELVAISLHSLLATLALMTGAGHTHTHTHQNVECVTHLLLLRGKGRSFWVEAVGRG